MSSCWEMISKIIYVRTVKIFRRYKRRIAASILTFVVWLTIWSQERFRPNTNIPAHIEVTHPKPVLKTNREFVLRNAINNVRLKDDYSSLYHVYDDTVDLRLIVMTFNRPDSLNKTLHSLQDFVTDGRRVSLEIWIDKPINSSRVNFETLRVAENFRWTNGIANVWIHSRHVGLVGQWLYTWRPGLRTGVVKDRELALFIEDDIDVSKFGYRWLRAVRAKYSGINDIACYTLQNDNAIGSHGKFARKEINKPYNSPVFFHRLPGSWAMSPDPEKWYQFQDWFETKHANSAFHPYVKLAALQTSWYKIFEKQKRQNSMWTMWYIYYMNEQKQICGYANLPAYTNRTGTSLASNRREPGLHFTKYLQHKHKILKLLTSWSEEYVNFPDTPPVFDFGGSIVRQKA